MIPDVPDNSPGVESVHTYWLSLSVGHWVMGIQGPVREEELGDLGTAKY